MRPTLGDFKKVKKNPRLMTEALKIQVMNTINYPSIAYKRHLNSQKKEIHKILKSKNFCIVILDACRYDYFKKLYNRFLDGKLLEVYSSGRDTFEFIRKTFPQKYDITYISGAPPINSFLKPEMFDSNLKYWYKSYIPSYHFKKIIDVWFYAWNEKLGSVHPQNVTKFALRHTYPRMIIHYLQPHAPYIGKPKILGTTGIKKTVLFKTPPDAKIARKFKQKKITIEKVKRAYEGNLKLVLKEVRKLLKKLNHDKIVITSDHGEFLGEYGFLFHPKIYSDILLRVPYLIVK